MHAAPQSETRMSKLSDILQRANEAGSPIPRAPGQWTPVACAVYNETMKTDREAARLLEAAIAHEMVTGRLVTPADEPAVRRRLDLMDAGPAAARAEQTG
jgi:hypothetical protein